MQHGMWFMTPAHGGYMHHAYGPLHGRYLHGPMADGTSCERFVSDSCYFLPGAARRGLLPYDQPLAGMHTFATLQSA